MSQDAAPVPGQAAAPGPLRTWLVRRAGFTESRVQDIMDALDAQHVDTVADLVEFKKLASFQTALPELTRVKIVAALSDDASAVPTPSTTEKHGTPEPDAGPPAKKAKQATPRPPKPSDAALAAFYKKVGSCEAKVREATQLDWCYKELRDNDATVIAYLIAEAMASLKELRLQANFIGDGGAAAIANALAVNASLNSLRLNVNNIGDPGAIAIAKALEVNASMTKLWLGGNKIGDAGAAAISNALTVNASLTLARLWVGSAINGNTQLVAACRAKGVTLE